MSDRINDDGANDEANKADQMAQPRPLIRLGLIIAVIVMIMDQASKWWMLEAVGMLDNPRVIEVTSYFNLVMAWNRGVSFSLFWHEAEYMPYLLSAVSLGRVGVVLFFVRNAGRPLPSLGAGLVGGGARRAGVCPRLILAPAAI